MSDDEDELTSAERHTLDVWTTLTPPAGFAERVVAARAVPARRRRWPVVAAGCAMAATAAIAILAVRSPSRAASGSLAASTRTTASLGDRAVAVAEPAAALAWRIDDDGTAEIDQTTGDVFYRVDRGGPFVVHTLAGDVRVTGTCFRIEVPMNAKVKQVLLSGTAGAAIATAVVVTVYEGHVIAETRAGKVELVAGSRATLAPDGTTTLAASATTIASTAADDANATREQLLARAAAQRAELGTLRARLAQFEARPGGPGFSSEAEDGRAFYDPSAETLREWAAECHVRADEPGFDRYQPMKSVDGHSRGLEPGELTAYNAAMAEVYQPYKALVRALYIEATGDTTGAETLSIEAMRSEMQEKSAPGEHNLILQRISRERAGLQPPPVDLARATPLERLIRAVTALGDQSEAALAKRLGAERAHAIRGDGWGSRSNWSGCPDTK